MPLVTVAIGERILEQKLFIAQAAFPANADTTRVLGEEVNFAIPVSPENPASNYTIYVSFRLTAAELAYNRRHRN